MAERLCVVMPVYNERDAIGCVLRKWSAALDALNIDYVIRPYNDGSKDDSLDVMRDVAKGLPRVEVRDKPNGGHGPTILQGYRESAADGFDWVFQIDSDDEMGPEKFGELWSRRNDYDFLVGIRDGRKQALPRKVISLVSRLCVRLLYGKSVWDVNTPYRLMRVSAFAAFFVNIPHDTFAPNVILSGLAAKHNLRCFEIPVPQRDRLTGEVSIKKWKLFKAAARSFGQTITFALDLRLFRSPYRMLTFMALVTGILLSAWFFLSPYRIAFGLLYIAIALGLLRHGAPGWCKCFLTWCRANPSKALFAVLAFGVLERAIFILVFPDLLDMDYINSDFAWLFEKARNVACGEWSVNKSWTTVVMWGGFIKLFGSSMMAANIFAMLIQIGATVFGYLFVRRWAGRIGALTFAFLFFCSINVLQHMPNITATEHTFSLFVLAALWCSGKVLDSRTNVAVVLYSIMLSVLMWTALWCRGEGLLLWMCLPFWIFLCQVLLLQVVRRAVVVIGVCSVMFCCGAIAAYKINFATSEAETIFCSDDNLWPRLHGATLASGGTCINTNSTLILNQYLADHPGVEWERFPADTPRWGKCRGPKKMFYNCPRELVPYVRNEIAKRWRDMSLSQMIPFVCKKELGDWCGDYLYTLQMTLTNGKSRVPYYLTQSTSFVFPSLIALLGFACCVWSLLRMLTGRCEVALAFPIVVVISFIVLNFAALALTESSMRYGYALHLLWPILGAVFVASVSDEPLPPLRSAA